ncbi:hypothetical protein HanXRQr2_Chr08g0335141 [Helianthus annuus]|uniref:Uncharacterized protein n=1 Tax=Helianthus annuus TaxID=4232 RepID=A0A9K3IDW2_HELAN|nr:hypothetical protein HanXRQr2_Chr08g0335141 [Helianthus annuus]
MPNNRMRSQLLKIFLQSHPPLLNKLMLLHNLALHHTFIWPRRNKTPSVRFQ